MNSSFVRPAAAAALALVAPAAALVPAHAGGDPGYPVGAVTVDGRATILEEPGVRLSGTYSCEGAGERLGSFVGDLRDRRGDIVAEFGLEGLACDGASHSWQLDVEASGVTPGRMWASGILLVCESSDGPCPGTLFESSVAVTPGH